MRKTVILVIIAILLVLLGYILLNQVQLKNGEWNILGVKALNAKNDALDAKIAELNRIISTDYSKAKANLTSSAKDYKQEKESYESLANVENSETSGTNQLENYEIEYLWARIGKHATDENVTLKMEIASSTATTSTGYYDLNFTAEGEYLDLTDFIYSVENDSYLGFKIEKFKLLPSSADGILRATFSCTNISINEKSIVVTTNKTTETEGTTDNKDKSYTTEENIPSGLQLQ